jgi:uncharacterized protein YjbI with pentapeptide repeats
MLEKQEQRAKRDRRSSKSPTSGWEKFWSWWKEFGSSFSTLVTIVSVIIGGLWTFNTYMTQQRDKLNQREREILLQQQSMVARFTNELNEPAARNNAAYSLAVLAKEEATPLLVANLAEAATEDNTESFLTALAQALIMIGEPALDPVIDLNRRFESDIVEEQSSAIVLATQPILTHFLKFQPDYFLDQPRLEGVQFSEANLHYSDLSRLNLRGVRIIKSNLCRVDLQSAVLSDSKLTDSELGGSNLSGADFTWADLSGTNFTGSELVDAVFDNANLQSVNLDLVDAYGVKLSGLDLAYSSLRSANFSDSELLGVYFYQVNAQDAIMRSADLKGSRFWRSNLYGVDFSGADVRDVIFYSDPNDFPYVDPDWSIESDLPSGGRGSLVKDADFKDAVNVSHEMRVYLCRWGAINVPRGCTGVTQEFADYFIEDDQSSSFGFCF